MLVIKVGGSEGIDYGALQMIVARPKADERLSLEQGELNAQMGLTDDSAPLPGKACHLFSWKSAVTGEE